MYMYRLQWSWDPKCALKMSRCPVLYIHVHVDGLGPEHVPIREVSSFQRVVHVDGLGPEHVPIREVSSFQRVLHVCRGFNGVGT